MFAKKELSVYIGKNEYIRKNSINEFAKDLIINFYLDHSVYTFCILKKYIKLCSKPMDLK